ncbi:MAG TPA: protein kinase [Candidatus Eisenbacteria bacterium]|nr:protein kinase [Candidatus Eisenbacteria bacterium]
MTVGSDHSGAPTSSPPQELGHYVIEGELGRGGMGVVYLARDRKLDRHVAIKTLPAELARDPEQLARFEREAKLLASLNHPNIATIHGLEESVDATRYLILERVEGETLADRLQRGAMSIEDVSRLCEQVADALEGAHERGVIHRDLKPRNIMITPGGRVKVLDFGLAKRAQKDHAGSPEVSIAEDGVIAGTPGYMSPEQVLAQPQDQRTDIFAFGCILFEALSGMKAFDSESVMTLVAMVLHGEPDWTKLPGNTPAGFKHLIARCIEKDPAQRPATIHEVRNGIRAVLHEHASGHTSTLASLAGTLHNLPREVASFVGRERELEECARLLGQTRILTLTGSGGSGKTRLAIRLVTGMIPKHGGGVWFVDFGPLSEAAMVTQSVAQALGVKEESGRSLEKSLVERLNGPPTLLVLDNCEHVLEPAGALIETLLQGCENLKVVATSREALSLSGEQVYSVPTLPVPETGKRYSVEALAGYASVRLFMERALQVQPAFVLDARNAAAIADICRRLDGIPFAIELAAARVKVLAVEQIRAKLDDRFRLLTGGSKAALPRQQTLRATIQWSYDHLHPEEQQLMRALSVFAGGWTLEAATAVTGVSEDEFEVLDHLTRLVDKSLVVVEHLRGGDSRYRYLETVRQYALERLLEAGESEAARDRHITFFCNFAEQAEPHLRGRDQADWIRRLGLEHENLQAAIAWGGRPGGEPEQALRLGAAVWRFWLSSGHLGLGRRLLEGLVALKAEQPETRAKVLYGSSLLAYAQGDYEAAEKRIDECLPVFRETGNGDRVSACLGMLGNIAGQRNDYDLARKRYEEALEISRQSGNRMALATHLNNLGNVARRQGDVTAARTMFDEAASEMRALGDQSSLSMVLGNLGNIANAQGDLPASRGYLREAFQITKELGAQRQLPVLLELGADLADRLGDFSRAVTMRGAADALREDAGMPIGAADRVHEESIVSQLREKVGIGVFEEAWSAGRSIGLDEAIAQAQSWLESVPMPNGTPAVG